MNKTLAIAAENAIHHGDFETQKGYCCRLVREVDETTDGLKYDALFRGDGTERDATAARAGRRFLKAGLAFLASELAAHGGLQPGDILVKTTVAKNRWGDFSGHIGILCMDCARMAENSSTSIGRVRGALGFRSLEQWGHFDIVIRLPDPVATQSPAPVPAPVPAIEAKLPPTPIYTLNGHALTGAVTQGNHLWAPVRDTLGAVGFIMQETDPGSGQWKAWREGSA